MKTARLGFMSILIVSMGIIVSCRLDVPIKEMMQARAAINKARVVLAEKYDPENLQKAVEQLYKCHDNLKDKDTDKAKKSALASLLYATAAIEASLPRAAEDTLAEAKAVLKEADNLSAETLAREQFERAGSMISEAEKLKNDKMLFESFMKSKEAIPLAREAKEEALKKVPQVTESIDKIKAEVADLQSQKISDPQKQELTLVSAKLDEAAQLVSQNNVKQAMPLIGESEKTVGRMKASIRKISIKEKIDAVRKDAEKVKKERGSDAASEDIDGVVTMLNEAETLMEQDKNDEAWDKALDAEKALAAISDKSFKTLALEKSKSVGKLIEDAKARDAGSKHEEEISAASVLHSEGNELLENEYYRESLAKFTEAESILNTFSVAREKDTLKDDKKAGDLEGKRVYKVEYNRKKRDCLWRIAHKVYKQANLWPLIYAANKDQIKDPDIIFPGQTFLIPDIPAKK